MIFGHKLAALLSAVIFLGMILCKVSYAESPGLVELFAELKKDKTEVIQFREERVAFYLDEPVQYTGELLFSPPGRLVKKIYKPKYRKVVMDKDRFEVYSRNELEVTLQINKSKGLYVLYKTLVSILTGDLSEIQRMFSVKYTNNHGDWHIYLEPQEDVVGKWVSNIQLSGRHNKIDEIKIVEPNGDYSVLHLYDR